MRLAEVGSAPCRKGLASVSRKYYKSFDDATCGVLLPSDNMSSREQSAAERTSNVL